jgi:hypothetical protein
MRLSVGMDYGVTTWGSLYFAVYYPRMKVKLAPIGLLLDEGSNS